ncbi:hypothetical protein VKT23_012094 [Stygiomarasmius scandens]|uniref:Uncharacterized protein n=1 Tax=Marasmiellus scandens TaxID=2682957 RepID=A0ABR1J9H3_9AGAR
MSSKPVPSLLLFNHQDTPTTPGNQAYPHSAQIISQVLSHIYQYPTNHATVLSKISQRLAEGDSSIENERIDDESATQFVKQFVRGTVEVEVKDLQPTPPSSGESEGRTCILDKLVEAVEQASTRPELFRDFEEQDPALAFKTLLAITFYHEVTCAMRFVLFPKYSGRLGPCDKIQLSEDKTVDVEESGWAVEWLAIGGRLALSISGKDFTGATRLVSASQVRDIKDVFTVDNEYLVSFMSTLEANESPLPQLPPTESRSPIASQRSEYYARLTTTDFFKKASPLFIRPDERLVGIGIAARTDEDGKLVYTRRGCPRGVGLAASQASKGS